MDPPSFDKPLLSLPATLLNYISVSRFSSLSFTWLQNIFLIMPASAHRYCFPSTYCPHPYQYWHPVNDETKLENSQTFYPLSSDFYVGLVSGSTPLSVLHSLQAPQKFPLCCILMPPSWLPSHPLQLPFTASRTGSHLLWSQNTHLSKLFDLATMQWIFIKHLLNSGHCFRHSELMTWLSRSCYSKCGPLTSGKSITREHIRNVSSQALLQIN